MLLPPSLGSAALIRTYVKSTPVPRMAVADIQRELAHWQRLLEGQRSAEQDRPDNRLAELERKVQLWGGVALGFGGVPVLWAHPAVGFCMAVAGCALSVRTVFIVARSSRARRRMIKSIKLASDRRDALIGELVRRTKQ